jgi:hypothetical protein
VSHQGRFISPLASPAFWHIVSGNTNATESAVDTPMPAACTLNALHVLTRAHTTAGNPPGGHNYTFTLRKNGVSTALECSLVSVTAGTESCSNTTSTVDVVAGDLINGMVVDTTSGLTLTPIFPILYAVNCR